MHFKMGKLTKNERNLAEIVQYTRIVHFFKRFVLDILGKRGQNRGQNWDRKFVVPFSSI